MSASDPGRQPSRWICTASRAVHAVGIDRCPSCGGEPAMVSGKLLLLPPWLDEGQVKQIREDLPAIIAAHEERE